MINILSCHAPVLIVVLFVLCVNVTMKYNRLKMNYASFMRGKDGKTLEREHEGQVPREVDASLKLPTNRLDIRKSAKRWRTIIRIRNCQIWPFNEMGGKLSLLAMLDGNNSGWVINAMHSREGCRSTYVKEIVKEKVM